METRVLPRCVEEIGRFALGVFTVLRTVTLGMLRISVQYARP
jgi:hypothetical protein